MKRLSHRKWKNLFSASSVLHSDIEPETLSERCVAAANKLVASDITAFDFFNEQGVHTGKHWYDPPDAIREADYEIFVHVAHEHPFAPDVFGKKRCDAMMTSDFLTTQQFHRTAIYNEFFKVCSVNQQLLAAFSDAPDSVITFNFSRAKGNFSEEERLIVNLISQHLRTAFLNARKIERFYKNETSLNSALESKSGGVIVLNADKQIVYENKFARLMLEKHFADEKTENNFLPDSLNGWLENEYNKFGDDKISPPSEVFRVENKDEKLEIHFIYNLETRETTLLIEETRNPSPKMLEHLNLTGREREILFLISQGKTNKEIALLCGVSWRTIQKHTENIFVKLGVETRTAAMLRALETLRQ